jgi:hypothetical protein
MQAASKQRLGKQTYAQVQWRHTPTVLVITWFIFGVVRVEAGSNTSTVTLRVVGGDEKGSLKSETIKYGHEKD